MSENYYDSNLDFMSFLIQTLEISNLNILLSK